MQRWRAGLVLALGAAGGGCAPSPDSTAVEAPADGAGRAEGRPVRFEASNPRRTWEVHVDGELACRTPCELNVHGNPRIELLLREEGRVVREAEVTELPGDGPIVVRAHGARGQRVAGIILLATGGAMAQFGLLATLLDRPQARYYFIGGGLLAATGVGLLLGTVAASAGATVIPARDDEGEEGDEDIVEPLELEDDGASAPRPTLMIGPGFVLGTF